MSYGCKDKRFSAMLCYIYLRIPYTFCGILYTSRWSCLPPIHLRWDIEKIWENLKNIIFSNILRYSVYPRLRGRMTNKAPRQHGYPRLRQCLPTKSVITAPSIIINSFFADDRKLVRQCPLSTTSISVHWLQDTVSIQRIGLLYAIVSEGIVSKHFIFMLLYSKKGRHNCRPLLLGDD